MSYDRFTPSEQERNDWESMVIMRAVAVLFCLFLTLTVITVCCQIKKHHNQPAQSAKE